MATGSRSYRGGMLPLRSSRSAACSGAQVLAIVTPCWAGTTGSSVVGRKGDADGSTAGRRAALADESGVPGTAVGHLLPALALRAQGREGGARGPGQVHLRHVPRTAA